MLPPVYIVDWKFLIVLRRREWILFLETSKGWDIAEDIPVSCMTSRHPLRHAGIYPQLTR